MPFRRYWNLRGIHGSWIVVDGRDLQPDEERRVVPGIFVEGRVATWAREPSARCVLLEMYGAVVGSGGFQAPSTESVHNAVDVVQAAFRRGRLIAVEEPRRAVPEMTAPVEAALRGLKRVPRPKPQVQTPEPTPGFRGPTVRSDPLENIEIIVKTEEGVPMGGVRVRLTLPDQTVHDNLRTSAGGIVYLSNIPAGQCQLELPELDQEAWSLKS